MSVRLILAVLMVGLVQCTKKVEAPKVKYLNFDSPVRYVYKDLKDFNTAANVEGTPVSRDQLLSQEPALQELQEKYNESLYVFVYAWGKMLADKKAEAVEVTLFNSQPKKELNEILESQAIESSDQVTVKFEPTETFGVVAQAGTEKVTWDDYIRANLAHGKLYKNLYTQRMRRLDGIVIRRFILEASKAADIPMEEYVRKNIMTQELDPTLEDVQAFAKEKGIAESDLNEKMVERLKDIVKQGHRDKLVADYVAKNLIKKPIEVNFQSGQVFIAVEFENSPDFEPPQWGKSEPDVVFFGDWSCKACSESLKTFLDTKRNWGERARGSFVFSFPERDRETRMGAEAALCVQSQNAEAFWSFLENMANQEESDLEKKIYAAVDSSGADSQSFKNCFLKREFKDEVNGHLSFAKYLGITKTPIMVIEGKVYEPPFDPQFIGDALKSFGGEVKKTGLWAKIKAFFGF